MMDKRTVELLNESKGESIHLVYGQVMTEKGPQGLAEMGTLVEATEGGVMMRSDQRGRLFFRWEQVHSMVFPSQIQVARVTPNVA